MIRKAGIIFILSILPFLAMAQCTGQGVVCDSDELLALQDLYTSLGVANWPLAEKWVLTGITPFTNSATAYSPVFGVTVLNGDVVSIKIQNDIHIVCSNLGTTNLSKLSQLTEFTITSGDGAISGGTTNVVGGPLPTAAFSSMIKLVTLNFKGNQFSGSLPTMRNSSSVSATNLKTINFAHPTTAAGFLAGTVIPAEWQYLTALQSITLDYCHLASGPPNTPFPSNLNTLTQLTTLSIKGNSFNGFGSALPGLTQLNFIDASQTLIATLPASFGSSHTALQTLNLSGNGITTANLGALVTNLSGASSLANLSLVGNQIAALPSGLSSFTSLHYLDLTNNILQKQTTSLDVLNSMTGLTDLRLAQNILLTDLPTPFLLTQLQHLELELDGFKVFPQALNNTSLTSLTYLDFSSNAHLSVVPSWINKLSNLNHLDLSYDSLYGTLEPNVAALTNLGWLSVKSNKLMAVPSFNARTTLIELYLNDNQITGSFSLTVPLMRLDVSNNKFSGVFSVNTTNIIVLYINNNQFSSFTPRLLGTIRPIDLKMGTNKINFGDMQLNMNGSGGVSTFGTISYVPQTMDFGAPQTVYGYEGLPITFVLPDLAPGTSSDPRTTYTWQKSDGMGGWSNVTNGGGNTYNFSKGVVAIGDAGTYQCVATNGYASGITITSSPIIFVIKPPLCTTNIQATGTIKFSLDKATGKIVYRRTDCPSIVELSCIYAPAQLVNGVVASSANTLSDSWVETNYYAGTAATGIQFSASANDYEKGFAGKWRQKGSYAFNTSLPHYDKTYNSGIYSFKPFSWKNTATSNSSQWIKVSEVNRYTPNGDAIQETDALGLKSAAKFGYHDAVPTLVAKNASYDQVMFESFENVYGTGKYEDGYTTTIATRVTGNGNFHSGKYGIQLAGNTTLPLKSMAVSAKGQIKFWIKLTDWTLGPTLSTDLVVGVFEDGSITPTVTVVAQSGEWALCEVIIASFNALTTYTPNIRYNRSNAVLIDDIRIQPFDSEMTAYVYDVRSLKPLTVFDDQHFGVYYQYSGEGKLIRKMIETEKGLKTVQDAQYNSATR